MSQILHVFRKDVRHLWIEITLSLIAVCLRTYSDWLMCTPRSRPVWFMDVGPVLLLFFVWWFMVVRLVHSEAPVGDKQFWITRPYVWHQLFAAKMLFIIVFISIPTAISEFVLLKLAHAPFLPHVSGILGTFLFLIIIGMLPALALASITTKLSQWIIGAIILIFVLIGLSAIDRYIPNSHVPSGTDDYGYLQVVAFCLLAGGGVLVQYARRRRTLVTITFAAAVISIPAIMLATPYRSMIAKAFPIASWQQVPFRIALQPPPKRTPNAPRADKEKRVHVAFPVEISGVPDGNFLQFNGFMLSVDSPDGHHWESEWLAGYREVLYNPEKSLLDVYLDRSILEKLKDTPVDAHLFAAFTEFRESQPIRLSVNDEFELPDIGHCWLDRDGYSISCRSTDIAPGLTLVTFSSADSTCPAQPTNEHGDKDEQTERKPVKSLGRNNATGPLSPLTMRTFSFYQWVNSKSNVSRVCPGTPVIFSTPQQVRKAQVQVDLGKLRLQEYAEASFGFGSVSIGVR